MVCAKIFFFVITRFNFIWISSEVFKEEILFSFAFLSMLYCIKNTPKAILLVILIHSEKTSLENFLKTHSEKTLFRLK